MKKKILIVEDEFVVANDLAIMLEKSGYETLGIAASASAAMDRMAETMPDLVLLDIQLQGSESGIDLARKLKSQHIAYVYLSANSDQATLQKARATEPYGFLVKPVRPKDLLVTLDIACYRHEHSRESYLFRKDRLRRELAVLANEESPLWSGFAELIQPVIPFDLLCFVHRNQAAEYEFRGLYRSGFNEYQDIDKAGLKNIIAKNQNEIDLVLSARTEKAGFLQFSGGEYDEFLKEDRLAFLLDRTYSCRSVIRGVIPSASATMYIFNKEPYTFDDRHLSVLEELQVVIGRLLTKAGGTGTLPIHPLVHRFVGKSKAIANCLDLVAQVAPLNTSVLITGESGTGKELVAEAIHDLSGRKGQPFIKINCAALPYTLIESELFGYEKGAFTGALTSRMGKFEAASAGTIFLDEIGEMDLDVQVKLLRVLQERTIQRIGGHKDIEVDVRIIAATNRNLEEAVAGHRFRLDLYFRLNVFPIQLPPLRQRKEDIPLLVEHLGKKIAQGLGRSYHGISVEMMAALEQYHWPGNVRELENVIQRALIVSASGQPMNLPQPLSDIYRSFEDNARASKLETREGAFPAATTVDGIKQRQEQFERELIEAALRNAKGKIRGAGGAAELLDIKPTTLESKIIRLGIKKDDFK